MAWALYLSTASSTSVTDAQLAELDDYELAARAGPSTRTTHLSHRLGPILHALVCTAGAINSRTQMLRSVSLLHSLLSTASPHVLSSAIPQLVHSFLADARASPHCDDAAAQDPPFLRPLVNIAITRVSDVELSTLAAHALAILLSHPAFDSDDSLYTRSLPAHIRAQAHVHTRRLIAMLITEVVLTSSPRALAALSRLLRRDDARAAFCAKDGVSTLASTLLTTPGKRHTAIGELVATAPPSAHSDDADPVDASYHAVFSVWMLTFARRPDILNTVLQHVVSSRLVVILARLLDHGSGQRLKIARVTLAALCNMAVGDGPLRRRVRRDLLAAGVPAVLHRLLLMASVRGSLMGSDDDAVADAQTLLDVLSAERDTMSTVDAYVAEVRAGALQPSPVHADEVFWLQHSDDIVVQFRDVVHSLADTVTDGVAAIEKRVIACEDLAHLVRASVNARRVIRDIDGLKPCLMALMVDAPDAKLKTSALLCVQHMLLRRSLRRTT